MSSRSPHQRVPLQAITRLVLEVNAKALTKGLMVKSGDSLQMIHLLVSYDSLQTCEISDSVRRTKLVDMKGTKIWDWPTTTMRTSWSTRAMLRNQYMILQKVQFTKVAKQFKQDQRQPTSSSREKALDLTWLPRNKQLRKLSPNEKQSVRTSWKKRTAIALALLSQEKSIPVCSGEH